MKKEKEKRFPASGRRNPFLKGQIRSLSLKGRDPDLAQGSGIRVTASLSGTLHLTRGKSLREGKGLFDAKQLISKKGQK